MQTAYLASLVSKVEVGLEVTGHPSLYLLCHCPSLPLLPSGHCGASHIMPMFLCVPTAIQLHQGVTEGWTSRSNMLGILLSKRFLFAYMVY